MRRCIGKRLKARPSFVISALEFSEASKLYIADLAHLLMCTIP